MSSARKLKLITERQSASYNSPWHHSFIEIEDDIREVGQMVMLAAMAAASAKADLAIFALYKAQDSTAELRRTYYSLHKRASRGRSGD